MTEGGPAPRLYLVTPPALTEATIGEIAALLDSHPVACLRLALATSDEAQILRAAGRLRDLCHARAVDIVIAEHFRLAARAGLDGVHLTGTRLVREARRQLGADAIVGAFCGTSRHEGMTAAEIGADYVSFGPVTASALGDGRIAGHDLFAWWSEMIETPVVAEGAVTAESAARLAPVIDFLAPGPELWSDPDGPVAALDRIVAALPA